MKALSVPGAPVHAAGKIEAAFLVLAEESFHNRRFRAAIAGNNNR
jgi:hypothetical protein